jgi:S1-C subfamily serine protease
MDIIEQFSSALADRVAAAAPSVVALKAGSRHRSGILWRPDVVVTSEQMVGEQTQAVIVQGGNEVPAKLAGRDPATNVAVFRLEGRLSGTTPTEGGMPRVGSLALVVGADQAGAATGRLAMVHATGPAWHSMAGGRIDTLIRLDVRVGADEGGPVLDHAGLFLGMSTSGPRRRGQVIRCWNRATSRAAGWASTCSRWRCQTPYRRRPASRAARWCCDWSAARQPSRPACCQATSCCRSTISALVSAAVWRL